MSNPAHRILSSVVLLALAASPAAAQQDGTFPPSGGGGDRPEGARPGMRGDPAQMVERMMSQDANGDGKLARDEVPGPFADRIFERADTNGDGFVDRGELEIFAKSMPARQGGMRGEGAPGGAGPGAPGGGGPASGGPASGGPASGGPGSVAPNAPANLEAAMKQVNRAYRQLRASGFDAASRERDLGSVQALQSGLLACKAMPAPPVTDAWKAKNGDDEAAYRVALRKAFVKTALVAMELEMAILEGDAARAKTLVEKIRDTQESGHALFQQEGDEKAPADAQRARGARGRASGEAPAAE